MTEKGNPMFLSSMNVGEQLFEDSQKAFSSKVVPAGMKRISPAEWKARIDRDPAFAQAEMARLQKDMGRRAGRTRFLEMWR